MISKVISGGQIGADLGALYGAKACSIPTGGTAPPQWKTDGKSQKKLLQSFGLVEGEEDPQIYPKRTMKNVDDSDGTVALLWCESVGTSKTIGYGLSKEWRFPANKEVSIYKPVLVITHKDLSNATWQVINFIENNEISTLNVAGPREKSAPGVQQFATDLIISVCNAYKNRK